MDKRGQLFFSKLNRTPPANDQSTVGKFKCGSCDRDACYDNIVQCDGCQVWYHFSCANVDNDIQDKDWFCDKCKEDTSNVNKVDARAQSTSSLKVSEDLIEINELEPRNIEPPQTPVDSQAELLAIPGQVENPNSTGAVPANMFKGLPNTNLRLSEKVLMDAVNRMKSRTVNQPINLTETNPQTRNLSADAFPFIQQSRPDLGSRKSHSTSSSSKRRNELMLKRIEEERKLTEKRDKEYLDKKYACLEDDLTSDSDIGNDDRADLTINWLMDQQDTASGFDPNWRPRNKVAEKFSSTTKPILRNQQTDENLKNYVPATSHINQRISKISVDNQAAVISGRPFSNQQIQLGSRSGIQGHVQPVNEVNVTSSSTNWIGSQPVSTGGIYFGGKMLNTNPIMSTSASEGFNRKSNAFIPSIPYSSAGLGNNTQLQINKTKPYGGGILNSMFQPQANNTKTSIVGGGFNIPVQPQISSTATSSGSGMLNSTFQTQHSNNNPNTTSSHQMNTTYTSYFGGNPGGNPYSSGPITSTYNSGGFGTIIQPQMGSATVPPTSVMNTQPTGSHTVVPWGYNFGMPGAIDQQKIATRLVFKNKELKFSGKPEDWPLFMEQFEETTRLCGYTDRENLSRLRDVLKGEALESVNSMLQGSMNLPVVLATLQMLYGKPETIINALLKKARETEPIRFGKLNQLIKFALTVLNLCGTMVSNNLRHYLHNPVLLQELVSKLPDSLKMEWGSLKRYNPDVNLSDFGNWLFDKARDASEVVDVESKSKNNSEKKPESKPKEKEKSDAWINSHAEADSTDDVKKMESGNSKKKYADKRSEKSNSYSSSCPICQKNQCKSVSDCVKFKALSQKERWDKVIENKLCGRCFGHHHHFRCKIKRKCGINGCERLHHVLLHKDNVDEKKTSEAKVKKESAGSQHSSVNTHQLHGENTFLPIVPVFLNQNGLSVKTYAFLDEGSTITLVDESLSNQLKLKGTPKNLCLRWTSGVVRSENKSKVISLNVSGIRKEHSNYKLPVVRTVESLGLPDQSMDLEKLTQKYPYLKDITVDGFKQAKIGILIGGNYAKLALSRDVREGDWSEPVAKKTRLGWVISGPHDGEAGQGNFVHYHVHECPCQGECDKELDKLVTEFFSLENFGVQVSSRGIESKEEQRARHILESTTKFLGDRYETGLIWRYDKINLPNNFEMALRRLECVEKKMSSDPKLFENFNKQVEEFLVKGYARKLRQSELPLPKGKSWYLPLFPHIHPKKPEKIRPVWDAAAKYKGVSLNSTLLSGPDLYVALPDVLLRFRQKKIAVCGDIKEMYHQVRIREEDQYAQLFLWRNGKSSSTPETYVMQVMTFGSTCSPSCAQYVKNFNANKFIDKYPRAVESIVKNHYVDDLMDSVHTPEEATQLLKDVKYIHKQGGFEIRGFLSNSKEVLDTFGEDCKNSSKSLDIESPTVTERVLGMFWDIKTDCFTYLLKYTKIKDDVLSGKRRPTKRELLKTLMSIFDPLGLLSFFLVYLKIVMQETWINNLDWDEPLTDELYDKWKNWLKLLPQVENVRIPRLYSSLLSPNEPEVIEFHTFVDASENAYAAVSYMRIISGEDIEVVLVGAKTKVAPKQKLSIPKLELLSGVLGSRLALSLTKGLTVKIDRRYFHSDSQTVLGWIKSNQRKLRQFVAFRVGEIVDLTKEDEWRYVPSKENVADDATKWTKEPTFDQASRWFQGPHFLKKDESHWPKKISESGKTDEMMAEFKVHLAHIPVDPPTSIDPKRFSKWERMLRAQAYVYRFSEILLSKVRSKPIPEGPLTHEELNRAENMMYRLAQFDYFSEEIAILQCGNSTAKIESNSVLYKCSPYLDEFGVLRMRGRIDEAEEVNFETKRPIILPTKHRITRLIADSYHRKFFHCNRETVVNELIQKYHVPGVRVVVKKVKKDCQKCKNGQSKPCPPEMAELPKARVSHLTLPFSYVGIDYFGPMYVTIRRKTEKRWGVIFTCLTIRAVHIELAESLDTASCILCIRDFMALRGTPLEFFSDQGTNLKAADKELKDELKNVDQYSLQTRFSVHSKWNFNPPSSPHMGGSWERLIRSVKTCLKQALPERNPPYEILRNLLLEVANIVNSRPLTFVSIDSADDEALTPNHSLVGTSCGLKPPGEYSEDAKFFGRNWRISQQRVNYFWKRWVRSYLPTLTRRTKWFEKVKPIEIGDAVVIIDEKNYRNTWLKGIVIDTPKVDKNGQVRSATVKVVKAVGPPKVDKNGKIDVETVERVYVRPVHKLAVLDVKSEQNEVEVKQI